VPITLRFALRIKNTEQSTDAAAQLLGAGAPDNRHPADYGGNSRAILRPAILKIVLIFMGVPACF
jgi:hypothetical protein